MAQVYMLQNLEHDNVLYEKGTLCELPDSVVEWAITEQLAQEVKLGAQAPAAPTEQAPEAPVVETPAEVPVTEPVTEDTTPKDLASNEIPSGDSPTDSVNDEAPAAPTEAQPIEVKVVR